MLLGAFVAALVLFALIAMALANIPLLLRVVLSVSLGLRLIYSFVQLGRNGLSNDARSYHEEAESALLFHQLGSAHSANTLFLGKEGWPVLLEYVYRMVGAEPFAGLAVNAVAVTLLAVVIFKTSKLLKVGDKGASAAAACTLFPQFTLWSSLLLREAIIWLAVALVSYFSVRLVKSARGNVFSIGGLVLAFALLFSFRASLAATFGLALLIGVVLSKSVPLLGKLGGFILAAAALPVVMQYLNESSLLDAERISLSRSELSAANTGFTTGASGDLLSQLVAFPEGLLRVLAGPFPWELIVLGPIAVIEWICWILLIVPAVWSLRRIPAGGLILVVLAIGSLVALTVSITNYGTLARLRIMTIVVLLPLIGVAWDARFDKKRVLKDRDYGFAEVQASSNGSMGDEYEPGDPQVAVGVDTAGG